MFEIKAKDAKTKARAGLLKVPHGGTVETPAYVIVGTRAKIQALPEERINDSKTQIVISNTYHLWRMLEQQKKFDTWKGLHKEMGYDGVIMTDSGGFQVFSLGFGREHEVSKVGFFSDARKVPGFLSDVYMQLKIFLGIRNKRNSVRVVPGGAYFRDENYGDKKSVFLNAEKSIALQEKLGADIILAFDECTSPKHGYWYTKWAMKRTHKWAKRSLHAKKNKEQLLYGIVQGGAFYNLRTKSAKTIGEMSFDGFAIGGSLGNTKEDMYEILEWTMPHLPEEKPRHLLGIGTIKDILEGVERGIDTFDCVIPTREARHAALWTSKGRIDIRKNLYKEDVGRIDDACTCPMCSGDEFVSRKKLHTLFRGEEAERKQAGEIATMHNIYFFNDFMRQIREAIQRGMFKEFKEEFLKKVS